MKSEILSAKQINYLFKQLFISTEYRKNNSVYLRLKAGLNLPRFLLFAALLYLPSLVYAQTTDYSFVVLGCNRVNDADSVGNPSTANIYQLNRMFTEVSQMNPLPKYLFFVGDLVLGYEKDTVKLASQLTNWINLYKASPLYGTSVQLVALEGNHETQDKAAGKKSFVAAERTFLGIMKDYILGNNGPAITGLVPGTDSLTTDQSKLTYSFNYKNDHFVLVNTDPVGRDAIASYKWIANDIKNARLNEVRHVFAIGHKPAYTGHFKATPDGLDVSAPQRDSFWNTLQQYQADAFFSAHVHVSDTIRPTGKTWQVIAGNGGSLVEPAFVSPPNAYFGYVVVSVYTNNQVHVNNMGRDAVMTDARYQDATPGNPTTLRASYNIGINPVIDHTPLSNTNVNGPFTVVANITDDNAVTGYQLNYFINGVAQAPLIPAIAGNTYTFTIPAQAGLGSIAYNIQANDVSGIKVYSTGAKTNYTTFTYGTSTATSSSQSSYVTPVADGVKFTSILTANDSVGGYKMVGIPDGLGAFDNGNGTFTLLMDHELGNTSGVVRAHGSKGAFVSKWVINKSNLSVVSGSDLIQRVYLYDTTSNTFVQGTTAFSRFCSADLPPVSAFYNSATGMGSQERIFMNGEESGAEGRAFGHIVTGANAGSSYQLPYLGKFSWENSVANPASGNKTIVAGTDDATVGGQVYFYVGTKTNSGTEIDKAGLNNGKLFGVAVTGMPSESSASVPAAGTRFGLYDLGSVQKRTGAAIDSISMASGVTNFLRPEDGAWDPKKPNDFYFVTTNAFTAPSRLWRLRFDDITNPQTGGNIEALLDGTEGQKMFDNIAIDSFGHVILLEDVGNNAHLGKVWQYTIATDSLLQLGVHDSTRFLSGGSRYLTEDEETSGVIDVQSILGPGMFLLVDQAHYTNGVPADIVEGGQLMAMFNPATSKSALPLTLVSFTAELKDNKTQLTWKTENEINTKYFEIERSSNGHDFAKVAVENAIGTGSNNYQIFDANPHTGNNYYRLKMVDKDGKYSYSSIQVVRIPTNGKFEFVMYPNPAKDVLTIVPAGTASPIQVSIFNQHGQKVLDKIISPSTTVIPISNLPKGVYFIQLISEGVSKVRKLSRE